MSDTPSRIPTLTDARLDELVARIKPVVEFDGVKRYIQPCHPRNVAYLWDPKPADKAPAFKRVAEIQTLHTYGYIGFFKPSIAEVLSQIPEQLVDQVIAFELHTTMIEVMFFGWPQHVNDLNAESEASNAGYHVAYATLYAAA